MNAKPKSRNSHEISRACTGPMSGNSINIKLGNNLEFIATYLFNHFGAKSTDVRRALCRFRKKEYHRGMYCSYFSDMPAYKKGQGQYRDRYWTKKDKRWYLTTQGMGLVKLKGDAGI